jgi:CHAT domain-containing protein
VKEEVKVIPNSTVLLNSDFTFNTLQQKINSQSFSVVHLATHGLFSSNPDETFIWATNQEKINVNRLINLLRSQQQNQPNSIKLLTLSACQTAKGDKWAALGIAGVAVRSGARSTIASLSNVPDKSTALMMSYLYEELGKPGVTKAEALRSAQRKILQDPEYKKPFYWSSFILLGSWR